MFTFYVSWQHLISFILSTFFVFDCIANKCTELKYMQAKI